MTTTPKVFRGTLEHQGLRLRFEVFCADGRRSAAMDPTDAAWDLVDPADLGSLLRRAQAGHAAGSSVCEVCAGRGCANAACVNGRVGRWVPAEAQRMPGKCGWYVGDVTGPRPVGGRLAILLDSTEALATAREAFGTQARIWSAHCHYAHCQGCGAVVRLEQRPALRQCPLCGARLRRHLEAA